MSFALPSLLDNTNNWGAFIFFSGWCGVSMIYVYLVVPEISGLSIEEMDDVFNQPWLSARHYRRPEVPREIEGDSEGVQPAS